jgi:hypothetical protein
MSIVLPVSISNFPPHSRWAYLNGSRNETFTWSSIVRAAIVAGYPELPAILSRQFARWRAAGLRLGLRHLVFTKTAAIESSEIDIFHVF